MAVKRPLALYAGTVQELASTDTLPSGGGSLSVPTGTINGSNTVFTLASAPNGDCLVFLNGLVVLKTEYTVVGTTLTFTTAPETGDALQVLIGAELGSGVVVATNADTMAGVSTSRAVAPMELFRQWAHITSCTPSNDLFNGSNSGAGSAVYVKYLARQIIGPNASTAGYAVAARTQGNCHIWNCSPGMSPGHVRCDKTVCFFGLTHFGGNSGSGVVVRSLFGVADETAADLTVRGLGWRRTGVGALELTVHNGTSLTAVTSSFTPVTGEAFSWQVTNDGTGNCTLYVNGVSVATSSAGPSGSGNEYGAPYNGVIIREEVHCAAGTHSSALNVNWINGGFAVGA